MHFYTQVTIDVASPEAGVIQKVNLAVLLFLTNSKFFFFRCLGMSFILISKCGFFVG